MQADFFTMEALFMNGCQQDSSSSSFPPLAGWPNLSLVYQHECFLTFQLLKLPMKNVHFKKTTTTVNVAYLDNDQ